MIAQAERNFEEIVTSGLSLDRFFQEKKIVGTPQRLESRWRSSNDIYFVDTSAGPYILKRINQLADAETEIDYLAQLTATYPGFLPSIMARDGSALIMEYVEGEDLADVCQRPFSEAFPRIEAIGQNLRRVYTPQMGALGKSSALNQISYTHKYSGCTSNPDRSSEGLSGILPKWGEYLAEYPAQAIHNDLNSANTRITSEGSVRSIDPRADMLGIRDLAKDIGRLLASTISATHDNQYSISQSKQCADAIVNPWRDVNSGLANRTAFYVGQSFLSFSRWDMSRLAKEGLFDVGWDILVPGPGVYPTFGHVTSKLMSSLEKNAYLKS